MPTAKKSSLKRERYQMPPTIKAEINSRGLMPAYKARPAYQQNDYLGWIGRAKLEPTRKKRIDQMLSELEGGKFYMKMPWRGGRGIS